MHSPSAITPSACLRDQSASIPICLFDEPARFHDSRDRRLRPGTRPFPRSSALSRERSAADCLKAKAAEAWSGSAPRPAGKRTGFYTPRPRRKTRRKAAGPLCRAQNLNERIRCTVTAGASSSLAAAYDDAAQITWTSWPLLARSRATSVSNWLVAAESGQKNWFNSSSLNDSSPSLRAGVVCLLHAARASEQKRRDCQ